MKKLNLTFLTLCLFVSVVTLAQESETSTNNEYSFKGLYNSTDIGLLIGSSKNNLKSPFSFMTVMGYHINNKFSAGVGIGADFIEETYIPIVIDIRYHFRKSNFSPYVFIQSGYIVSTANEINLNSNQYIMDIWPGPYNPSEAKPTGGFLINPGIGIRKMFSEDFGITFSVSYRYHKLNYKGNDDSRLEVDYNRLNFRFGFIFK